MSLGADISFGFLKGMWRGLITLGTVVVTCTLWYASISNGLQANSLEIKEQLVRIKKAEAGLEQVKEARYLTEIKVLEAIAKIDSRLSRIEGGVRRIEQGNN